MCSIVFVIIIRRIAIAYAVYCYKLCIAWSVGLHVILRLSVSTGHEPIEVSFRVLTWVGPRDHELDGDADPPQKGAILENIPRSILNSNYGAFYRDDGWHVDT